MTFLVDKAFLREQQYRTSEALKKRWNFYDFMVTPVDISEQALTALTLQGSESLLDVGCGSGEFLNMLTTTGHTGRLVGVDISEGIVEAKAMEFYCTSADDLPFDDATFDVVTAFFMLYHMQDKKKSLLEWKRVMKSNGKLIVSTTGPTNKIKHKLWKRCIAARLHATVPLAFSESFHLDNGEQILRQVFARVHTKRFTGEVQLATPDPELATLESVRNTFTPYPNDTDWQRAIEDVQSQIQNEIDKNGYYTDTVERGFFVAYP